MGDESKKELTMSMDLKKLGEAYNIPFQEILDVIKKDRQIALDNYEILKGKLLTDNDDTAAAKEQLNEALRLIIESTEKLTSLMSSASKLWGDSVKAIAMQNSTKAPTSTEIQKANKDRRQNLLDSETENENQ